MSIRYKSKNEIKFTFTVLRDNIPYKIIEAYDAGTVTLDADSELKTSWRGVFFGYTDVDFTKDRLQIDCTVNGETYPVGVFCITTEIPYTSDGMRLVEVEAYSILWFLQQTILENRKIFHAGEAYVSVIQSLLIDAGFSNYEIEQSELQLTTDREDWDIGTNYLTIINDLLDEINYNKLFVTNTGKIKATKYLAPTTDQVTHTYTEGKDSIISADYRVKSDRYSKSNVFIVICDNPEFDETWRAESVNDDPASPYSVTNLGRRIASITYVDNTPSRAELKNYADKLNAQSKQTNEIIEFYTAIQPDHAPYDTVMVIVGGVAGVFRETGYEIEMNEGGQMKHTAERVIL